LRPIVSRRDNDIVDDDVDDFTPTSSTITLSWTSMSSRRHRHHDNSMSDVASLVVVDRRCWRSFLSFFICPNSSPCTTFNFT